MSQRVMLHEVVRDPSVVCFEVAAYFMARTDCPSLFKMEVVILGPRRDQDRRGRGTATGQQQAVLHRQSTSLLNAPVDSWERVSLMIKPPVLEGAYELVMILQGKDTRFWQGQYGSKVTGCSVRIVADTKAELNDLLLPPSENGGNPVNSQMQGRALWERDLLHERERQIYSTFSISWAGVMVGICALFLVWALIF